MLGMHLLHLVRLVEVLVGDIEVEHMLNQQDYNYNELLEVEILWRYNTIHLNKNNQYS